jgi:hypothetical protein
MKLNRTLAGATAGAALLVLSGGQAAMAATPGPVAKSSPGTCSAASLAFVQARVGLAVSKREVTINQLTAALAKRSHVSDAHRSTLSGLFTSDATGLQTVNATVHADTTCKQAVTDGRTVVTNFRVYMLLAPQTHLVAASDTGTYGAGRLTAVEPKLQAGIDAISDPTKKAQAQAAFEDLVAQAKTATDDFAGVGDAVLALTPATMPAGQSTLDVERAKVTSGRTAVTAAVQDAKTIASLLT